MTISRLLNFGDPAPMERGSAAGRKFLASPTTAIGESLRPRRAAAGRNFSHRLTAAASAQCLRLSERFIIIIIIIISYRQPAGTARSMLDERK